jgi:hypothetical protein
VDKEVRRLLLAEEARAESVIRAHREGLDRLVAALEKEESLDRAAIEAALGPSPLKAARPAVVASTEIDTDAIAGSAQEKSGAA